MAARATSWDQGYRVGIYISCTYKAPRGRHSDTSRAVTVRLARKVPNVEWLGHGFTSLLPRSMVMTTCVTRAVMDRGPTIEVTK